MDFFKMAFFTKNKKSKQRIVEEWVYEQVADELECNQIRKGLWTKAVSLSDGNESKCKGIYISLRAESIVDKEKIQKEVKEKDRKKLLLKSIMAEKEYEIIKKEHNEIINKRDEGIQQRRIEKNKIELINNKSIEKVLLDAIANNDIKLAKHLIEIGVSINSNELPISHSDYAEIYGNQEMISLIESN